MQEEIEVLKEYVESLGLNEKEKVEYDDWRELIASLKESGEYSLADYVIRLGNPEELQDFITGTLYG